MRFLSSNRVSQDMSESIALDIKTAPSDPGQTYPHLDFSTIDDTTCFLILKYLQPQDLLVISLVNRRWLSWANNDKLWGDAFAPQAATYKLTRTLSNKFQISLSRSSSGKPNPVLLMCCTQCGASTLVGGGNGFACDGCDQSLRSLYNNVKVSPLSCPSCLLSPFAVYIYIRTYVYRTN